VPSSCGGLGPGLERHAVSHAVQPAGQGSVPAQAAQVLGEDEEGGLEGVLGVLGVLQDAPADAVDHRAVALHHGVKRRLVPGGKDPFDEVPVGLVGEQLRRHAPRHGTEEAV
jgi:hypothetical protein